MERKKVPRVIEGTYTFVVDPTDADADDVDPLDVDALDVDTADVDTRQLEAGGLGAGDLDAARRPSEGAADDDGPAV
ncbi:hypothetical protein LN042_24245 [Kitasatospora sp. RB6PN24]|uniref:hypothetical protein n=1 Tax=Kitasatospora humi TaxID=2893891 RepID=UPI001E3245F3|nr:hypothetical protein [Kitasatospora humi]MCC9310141.1 hypothetical protein [Kitasatospora humi]